MRLRVTVPIVLLACATAGAETHITVDTASGQPGDAISIRAGYYQSESIPPNVYRIDSTARLTLNGQPDVYRLDQPVRTGPFAGFMESLDETQLELTSNFYQPTGRLDGGDFRYEITSVTPVAGGGGTMGARFAVAAPQEGLSGISSGEKRDDRSYDVGVGNLYDDEVMLADRPGLYDVSVVAWDANGRYADSAPVTFRINVIPEPVLAPLLGFVGLAFARRTRRV